MKNIKTPIKITRKTSIVLGLVVGLNTAILVKLPVTRRNIKRLGLAVGSPAETILWPRWDPLRRLSCDRWLVGNRFGLHRWRCSNGTMYKSKHSNHSRKGSEFLCKYQNVSRIRSGSVLRCQAIQVQHWVGGANISGVSPWREVAPPVVRSHHWVTLLWRRSVCSV